MGIVKRRVQNDNAIRTKYLPQLSATADAALRALNKHFGNGSVLTSIRNKIAFHYSDNDNLTEQSFQRMSGDEPLQFYLSKTVGNSFYHAAELVVELSALSLMCVSPKGPNDTKSSELRAFSALCSEIISVAGDITELFGDLIGILIKNTVTEDVSEPIPNAPKLSNFTLPFFFE
jgi:hypothetical protein